MLFVVDKGTQTCKRAFLILRLVTRFCTFDEDFFDNTSIGILPVVTQTHTRFYLVDVLSASTRRAESIPLDFPFIDNNIEGFCFGKHCYCSSRSVHTTLSFGSRHTLHTVHTTFILERAIDIGSCHGAHNFLVTTCSTFGEARNFEFPPFSFTILTVHAEKIACKKCSFVTTCATTNFKNGILGIFRIFGHKHEFNLFFQSGNALFTRSHFFTSHFFHFSIVLCHENALALC